MLLVTDDEESAFWLLDAVTARVLPGIRAPRPPIPYAAGQSLTYGPLNQGCMGPICAAWATTRRYRVG